MRSKKTLIIISAILSIIIIVLITAMIQSGIWEEGKYDAFAKCLTDKGATLYTTYWCPHCTEQKHVFESSLKYLDVVECDPEGENADPQKCGEKNITSIPAWEFGDGTIEVGLHTPEELAEITGCQLPQE